MRTNIQSIQISQMVDIPSFDALVASAPRLRSFKIECDGQVDTRQYSEEGTSALFPSDLIQIMTPLDGLRHTLGYLETYGMSNSGDFTNILGSLKDYRALTSLHINMLPWLHSRAEADSGPLFGCLGENLPPLI